MKPYQYMHKLLYELAIVVPAMNTTAHADTARLQAIQWFNGCGGNEFWIRPSPICRARLHGTVEGVVAGMSLSKGKPWICMPLEVGPREELLVFRKYLNDHPELLSQNLGIVVAAALAQAYPCH